MEYKKIFTPLGGGEEFKERIYGALLVAKYFNTHLEILHSIPGVKINRQVPSHIIEELEEFAKEKQAQETEKFTAVLQEIASEVAVKISKQPLENEASVHPLVQLGDRSSMVAQESKYSDLVVVAAPPNGIITATFESSVLESGKSVIVIPREMKSFKIDSVIIAWNNTEESSRAITASIDILKQAKKVHLVSSQEYLPEGDKLEKMKEYLAIHGIDITTEFVPTSLYPGEMLLNTSKDGNFDLLVAGAFGDTKGLKEIMFGGATKYLLKYSTIPIFMSH